MASEDIKRMENSIIDFANKLDDWVDKRNQFAEQQVNPEIKDTQKKDKASDLGPSTFDGVAPTTNSPLPSQSPLELESLDPSEGLDVRVRKERQARKKRVFTDARELSRFIQQYWPRSKTFTAENVVTFLRLVYSEFDRTQRGLADSPHQLEESLYLILDILQETIFECDMALFDLQLKDWDYWQKEQEDTVRTATVLAHCQENTAEFSPFPESRVYNLKADFKSFQEKYGESFYIDKMLRHPDGQILIRCVTKTPFYVDNHKDKQGKFAKRDFGAFIKDKMLRDLLTLAMKLYPEIKKNCLSSGSVFVTPFIRQDFPHLTQDGEKFFRWFSIQF